MSLKPLRERRSLPTSSRGLAPDDYLMRFDGAKRDR
jgi:hypothetical protein